MQIATTDQPQSLSDLMTTAQKQEISQFRHSIRSIAIQNGNAFPIHIKEGLKTDVLDTPEVGQDELAYIQTRKLEYVFIQNSTGNATGNVKLVYTLGQNA